MIQDTNGFWNKPHLDKLDKRITIIVNIDKEDPNNLGSSLYKNKFGHEEKKIKWKNNSALIFKPELNKWHGFTKMNFIGERQMVIINIPNTSDWILKDTLWIP